MNNVQRIQNEYEWSIKGSFDLNASAAIIASRGSNQTVTGPSPAGTYSIVVKGSGALKLVAVFLARTNLSLGTPTTALGCRITAITQNANTDDVTITLLTTAGAGDTGAAANTTAAITVNYEVVLQCGKMGNPL